MKVLEGEGKVKHTKFVVVKLRELVKTAIFAVLGLIILIGLITFFLRMGGAESSEGYYRDGVYEGALRTGQAESTVSVTIDKGKIKDVSLTQKDDALEVLYPLVEPAVAEVKKDVMKNQSAAIEDGKDYTYSAQAVLGAVRECLAEAKR